MPLNVPEATPPAEPSPPRGSRRLRRRIAKGALAFVAVCALLLAVLAWQAGRSSISLDLFEGRIEAAMRARLPADAEVELGSTTLSYRREAGLVVRAHDVRVELPGQLELKARELSTVATPLALLQRRVEMRSLTISDLLLDLSPTSIPVRGGSAAARIRGAAERFAVEIGQADDLLRRAGLEVVTVNGARIRIAVADAVFGPALAVSEASWQPLGQRRSKAWLQFVEAEGQPWDLTVERQVGRSGAGSVTAEVEDLPVAALAPRLADSDGGVHFSAAITLQARIRTDADGNFASMRGSLSTGRGSFSLSDNDLIALSGAQLRFGLAESDRLMIPAGQIRTAAGWVRFEGVADLSEAKGATLVGRVRDGNLPTIPPENRLRLLGGGVVARLGFPDRALSVERLDVVTEFGTVSAIGQGSLAGSSPGLSLALSMPEIPAAVARALWPPFIASKTRRWFDENVRSGTVGPATLQVALPPDFIGPAGRDRILPDYALIGSLPFRSGRFTPITTLPLIRDASGDIDFANATATLRVHAGVIAIDGKGELDASGTALVIPELGRPQPRGHLHLQIEGPASALAALSDIPPLSVAETRGVDADALSGMADLSLDVTIPLFESDLDEVTPAFRLALSDFTSTAPIAGRDISDADLVLEGNPESFTVKGGGVLDGIQATVDLILGGSSQHQSDVNLTLDEAARERLGLGLGGYVSGPVHASMQAMDDRQQVALDLKDARIALPFLGWEKGPGVPATAKFVMLKTEEGTRLEDLLVSGKGFSARGTAEIGPDGKLDALKLSEVALRPGDALTATLSARDGGYDVRVSGAVLDARGVLRAAKSGLGDGGRPEGDIRLDLQVEEVLGENDVTLGNVAGSIVVTGRGLDAAALTGSVNGTEAFEWTLKREGGTRVLRLFADNGGALIRFAGIYSKIAGGNLILDYNGEAGGVGNGVMLMRDFRIIGEDALAPALERPRQSDRDVASGRTAVVADGDLYFTQMRIPFRQDDWVLSIEDAALRGSMLGATAGGTVNIAGGKMAISGTFIPAFGLNNIAGSIPLIGTILGGGRDEGLLGITYKMFGPLDGPQLTMNPISALAPGIFRKIFEYN